MTTVKYKPITREFQYRDYCNALERLLFSGSKDRDAKDEIALLTLLIGKWDDIHNTFDDLDPIQILHSLMKEHDLKPEDLVPVLNTSKGYISDILYYKKKLSKEVTRKLANHFKISRQALNRPYRLTAPENAHEEKRAQ